MQNKAEFFDFRYHELVEEQKVLQAMIRQIVLYLSLGVLTQKLI